MSLLQRPTAKGKKTKNGLETDLVFAKNGVKNYNKAEQRKLDEKTRKFEENLEQRKKSIRQEEVELKRLLMGFRREKIESRQGLQKMRSFLNNVAQAEKQAGQARGPARRHHSVGVTTLQGVHKLLKINDGPKSEGRKSAENKQANSIGAAKRIVASAKKDTVSALDRKSRASVVAIPGTSKGMNEDKTDSTGQTSRSHLQTTSYAKLKRDSEAVMKRTRMKEVEEIEALISHGEDNAQKQEMLDQWIKILSDKDDILKEPEALFDLASDGKAELVTSKRSQARRMNALEHVLSQYMPGLKTKSQPILSANEALHCSYLRLPPSVVQELEEQCRLEGIDPGVHSHMTEEQVEEYFNKKYKTQHQHDDDDEDDTDSQVIVHY